MNATFRQTPTTTLHHIVYIDLVRWSWGHGLGAVSRSTSWSLESTRRSSSNPRSWQYTTWLESIINRKRISKCLLLLLQCPDLAKLKQQLLSSQRIVGLVWLKPNSSTNFRQKASSSAQLAALIHSASVCVGSVIYLVRQLLTKLISGIMLTKR